MNKVNIIGGGLAGCECAYQLAKRNIQVNLFDMKPKFTPAHKNVNLGELVCSNSLKSNDITTAGGLLKEELRHLDSLLIKVADETRVPAGNSLSVDRNLFSERITKCLCSQGSCCEDQYVSWLQLQVRSVEAGGRGDQGCLEVFPVLHKR